MDANRTTKSGGRLTMITGTAGQPVSQATVEEWCQAHRLDEVQGQQDRARLEDHR